MSWGGFDNRIIANRHKDTFIHGFFDVSGRTLINGNLFVGYDTSLNGNVNIGKDLTIAGRLSVKQYSAQNIINTTTTNYQLIVSEDLSLNGRMYVSGNVGIGVTAPVYTLDVSSASSAPFRVGVGATNAIVVNSTGAVGIGTGCLSVMNSSSNYINLGTVPGTSTRALWLNYSGTGTTADYGVIQAEHQGTAYRSLALNPLGGSVGIGTTNPSYALHVHSENSTNMLMLTSGPTNSLGKWGIIFDGGKNANMYFHANTGSNFDVFASVGYIENDTAGHVKMNFTGQHRCSYNETINSLTSEGLIVNATGEYWSLINDFDNTSQIDHITINEALPKITLTKTAYCKSVFGVVSYTEDPNNTRKFDGAGRFVSVYQNPLGEKKRVYVNSLGEGGIWVCNANGIFTNGDYITSSNVPGYGMAQGNGQMMNYTIGKITIDCDFNPQELPVYSFDKIITTDSSGNNITEAHKDSSGNVIFKQAIDSFGNVMTKPAYKIRYLDSNGTILSKDSYNEMISNGETAYIAAFVGCTYHCG